MILAKTTRFLDELAFWTFHGLANALPGALVAVAVLELHLSGAAVAGMVWAAVTLIISCTVLSISCRRLRDPGQRFSRALETAAWIQAAAVFALSPFMIMTLFMVMQSSGIDAEFESAYLLVTECLGLPREFPHGRDAPFLPVYLLALVTGALHVALLCLLTLLLEVAIRIRERTRMRIPCEGM